MSLGKNNAAGGGASLNFDVKAYATEVALLSATPKENTIGIITTTAINGWIFSATEPAEPAQGMVWITVGTESAIEFNALKKNTLQVYPQSAKQYVSGAWVDVISMSYQGGSWVEWIMYLYKSGDECTDITGGWTSSGYIVTGAETIPPTKNEDNIYIYGKGSPAMGCGVSGTENAIDLSNYTYLYFDVEITGAASNGISLECGVTTAKNISYPVAKVDCGAEIRRQIFSLDVSAISGSCNIYVSSGASVACAGHLYNCWVVR